MKKSDRQKVFDKYGGRCAYTGKPLGADWQVDHLYCKMETTILRKNRNDSDNMVPTLAIVNHYKRGLLFDHWRERIAKLHIRIAKLPKKTRATKTQKTKEYLLKVAEAFDITPDRPFSEVFYFETMQVK
jgi:hypothetical protein